MLLVLGNYDDNPSPRKLDFRTLNAPFGHGAEEVVFASGVRLDFAPFCMVAEAQGAEVVYCLLDVAATADEKMTQGFCVGAWGSNDWVFANVHDVFLVFSRVEKTKNLSHPTVNR